MARDTPAVVVLDLMQIQKTHTMVVVGVAQVAQADPHQMAVKTIEDLLEAIKSQVALGLQVI